MQLQLLGLVHLISCSEYLTEPKKRGRQLPRFFYPDASTEMLGGRDFAQSLI